MYILDLTNPLVLLGALMLYSFLMILGKEFKKSALPAISLLIFLATLVIYGVQMFVSKNVDTNFEQLLKTGLNKKSIDDSLDWFWNKV